MSIVPIDVQDGDNNLDVGVVERAIGRRSTQINTYFLLMTSNKCKSVFCVAPDYKKTPDLKKRLRQTCRLGFFYFLHLFILQAIYNVIQDLKMKMLFVELNIRLQE